jgi:hypothetical protein
MALITGVAPSANFDLQNWKLTLPVDSSGSFSGSASEVLNLEGYERPTYFYTAGDGAMVFSAPVEGATTSGSSYVRSELREMVGAERAAWTLSDGGTMTATLEVDQVPTRDDHSPGRVIVGQIHGQDEELVRLYWQDNSVYFMNDRAGADDAETRFDLTNQSGDSPNISLDERFSYRIDARDDTLNVSVSADGQVYSSETGISQTWDTDQFYFKAGMYLGVNGESGSGSGQASFYALGVSHSQQPTPLPQPEPVSQPTPAPPVVSTPVPTPTPTVPVDAVPTQPPVVSETDGKLLGTRSGDTLSGLAASEIIKGYGGDDIIDGSAGNDRIEGNAGNDRVTGGVGDDVVKGSRGADTFVFLEGHGHDVVRDLKSVDLVELDQDLVSNMDELHNALHRTDDGYVLTTGEDSAILFRGVEQSIFDTAHFIFV